MEENKKMIKKLVSFACCLLPIGAGAVTVNPEGADAFVSTEGAAWQNAISSGQTITVSAGNSILSENGFTITNNMYLGMDAQGSGNGDLYILSSVQNPFTIVSKGDVSVGAMLQVLDGKTLAFKSTDTGPVAFDLTVGNGGIKVGDTSATANLTMQNIDALNVGGVIQSYGNFTVSANSVNVGNLDVNAGNTAINTLTGAVAVDGITVDGVGTTNIVAATNIESDGTIQNNAGMMSLQAGNNISVTGSLENTGAGLSVDAGGLTVSGTMKNDSDGVLRINADSWTINGGSASEFSFVNGGDLYATVSGQTYMEYGINLDTMGQAKTFSLDTGTLEFGQDADIQAWGNVFANSLNVFNLAIRQGGLNLSTAVLNGANGNTDAEMSLWAQNIETTAITNNGQKLTVTATDGDVTVGGVVVGSAGTQTDVIASGTLSVIGGVTNQGDMTLNANTVSVNDVTNTGADAQMTVSSVTDSTGVVQIAGNLSNTQGTTTVWAKDVSVTGAVTNNSGTTTIRGSDTAGGAVQIGSINALGGTVNLDALAGDVDITSAMIVSGGNMNLGTSLNNLNVADGVGGVQISGDVIAGAADAVNAGDVAVKSDSLVLSAGVIDIAGNIDVTANDIARNVQFDATQIIVDGDVLVANQGLLTLGKEAESGVSVAGTLSVNNGGVFESYANNISVGELTGNGKILVHGAALTAQTGDISVDGNLYFDTANDPTTIANGMVVRDTNIMTIKTVADGADIALGGVSVGAENTLNLQSADAIALDGAVTNNGMIDLDAGAGVFVVGAVQNTDNMTLRAGGLAVLDADAQNSGEMEIVAENIDLANVSNTGGLIVTATNGVVTMGNVTTSDSLEISATTTISGGAISQTGGTMDLTANTLRAQSLVVGGTGTRANLAVSDVDVDGTVSVTGNMVQGDDSTAMLVHNAGEFNAGNLIVGGNLDLTAGNTIYNIGTNLNIVGDVTVDNGVTSEFTVGNTINADALTNAGDLSLTANRGVNLGVVTNNGGVLSIDSGTADAQLYSLNVAGGNVIFQGTGLDMNGALNTTGILYQGYRGALANKDINVKSSDYVINTSNLKVAGINQNGTMTVNTSDVDVGGDISATDLRFVAVPDTNWMNVSVDGSVSGAVDFIGLEKMTVAGNYDFGAASSINAVILPYATGSTIDSTDINYWSTVGYDSNNVVKIENAVDGNALINVGGTFTAGSSALNLADGATGALGGGQFGISLRDIVDQGTAIWFVHADGGIVNTSDLEKARNLTVRYCNADGSLCYDYLQSLDTNNGSGSDLPAYVAARDNDLYIVFDPRFGGPIEVFKLQPIVENYVLHTKGSVVSAGALDDLIAGRLKDKKFLNRTPIEVIPLAFQGTNMQEMANELYNRMEYYSENNHNPDALYNFSRLFQVRELELIAGGIALNEHTAFRSFEDRMFDEFIWNRNRNLNKAWVDVDFGMFYQNIQDGKHTDGNRFSISGGFDWQESNTLQLGLTGRIARTGAKAGDKMDLGYVPGESIDGRVSVDVVDTNIGLGAYLMKTVSEKVRLYGNAFMDMHMLDVNRTQNYVDTIDGDGTAFSLISEWGLMHDILNQYIVGNAYARVGYNFGFDVKEKVGGHDYMRLQSDGYMILTPGYSLTAQKRIYPSAWFQIRPYASIGVEYDILGAPDRVEYKFTPADSYTEYRVDIDPLWANIGGGIEMLSANGLQFGIDYRYQYNSDIQLHNIRISGSYRF